MRVNLAKSQSPSLRGSGRFPHRRAASHAYTARRLNPLHCGAVVASSSVRIGKRRHGRVSIPFIAGQWSLHVDAVIDTGGVCESQSPSLRGSGRFRSPARTKMSHGRRVSIPFIAGQWSLREDPRRRAASRHVSIPFIAGQWSLLLMSSIAMISPVASQSPSLRGSGRF